MREYDECNEKAVIEELKDLIERPSLDGGDYRDSVFSGIERLLKEEGIETDWKELENYISYVLDCYLEDKRPEWNNERERSIIETIQGYLDAEIEASIYKCKEAKEEFDKHMRTWIKEEKKWEQEYLEELKKEGLL